VAGEEYGAAGSTPAVVSQHLCQESPTDATAAVGWMDVHVRAPRRVAGIYAADPADELRALDRHILAKRSVGAEVFGRNGARPRGPRKAGRQGWRIDDRDRDGSSDSGNALQPMHKERLRRQQPIVQLLVRRFERQVGLLRGTEYAQKEPAAGSLAGRFVHDLRIHTVSNPLFLPIVARILAGSIAQQPERAYPERFVRVRAALRRTKTLYKDLQGPLDFTIASRHQLSSWRCAGQGF